MIYKCECCGTETPLDDGDALGHICGVCAWEYDFAPSETILGPNHVTLEEGRENYRKHGRCEQDWRGTWGDSPESKEATT